MSKQRAAAGATGEAFFFFLLFLPAFFTETHEILENNIFVFLPENMKTNRTQKSIPRAAANGIFAETVTATFDT